MPRIGLSVATIASFTMRRLSMLGSDDSDSMLGMEMPFDE